MQLHTVQPPHRHNSVALDLCVSAKPGVYTLMGPELDEDGYAEKCGEEHGNLSFIFALASLSIHIVTQLLLGPELKPVLNHFSSHHYLHAFSLSSIDG